MGVNFLGGYSALTQKGMTRADERLIQSIPEVLCTTQRLCSSVNVGSTRAGLNMNAIREMGEIIKKTAARSAVRTAWLRQAGGVCQCGGGQSLHGRRLLRRGRAGMRH